ncbi:MAG: flagellar biosynthetic protein FliO [Planctomycetota bacterium]
MPTIVVLLIAIAPASYANESEPSDAAVQAIQRARALAQRAAADTPAAETTNAAPVEADGEPALAAMASADAPRPLGAPSAAFSPLDRVSAVDGDTGWVLSTLSALGVVIGLVFAARWCLTKMKAGADPVARSAAVEVLARVPIGSRQRITLLRIGGRVVVLGDAGGSLTTLAEIDDDQEVADLLQSVSTSRSDSAAAGFRDLYRQMAGLGGRRDAVDGDDTLDLDARPPRDAHGDRSHDEVRRLLSRVRGAAASFTPSPGTAR